MMGGRVAGGVRGGASGWEESGRRRCSERRYIGWKTWLEVGWREVGGYRAGWELTWSRMGSRVRGSRV